MTGYRKSLPCRDAQSGTDGSEARLGNGAIRIGAPVLSARDAGLRHACSVSDENGQRTLWFEIGEQFAGMVVDSSEPALLALLNKQTERFNAADSRPWELAAGDPVKLPALPDGISPAQAAPVAPGDFSCSGKRCCGEMASCAEAQFYLQSCGVRSLDRDRDGLACNSLCGR